MPSEKVHLPTTGWDKADHLLAYAAMAALGCLGWSGRTLLMLASLLVFGIAIEVLQALSGYRSGELRDVIAECLGLGIGVAFAWGAGKLLGPSSGS